MDIPKYYDASDDQLKPVTQEWVDNSQSIMITQHKKAEAIKALANLIIVKDKMLLNDIFKLLGV